MENKNKNKVLVSCKGKERNGMSTMSVDLNKYIKEIKKGGKNGKRY